MYDICHTSICGVCRYFFFIIINSVCLIIHICPNIINNIVNHHNISNYVHLNTTLPVMLKIIIIF